MALKAKYVSQDEIPEAHRELYEERGGEYHLTQIEGIKTDADVARVQRALEQERAGHQDAKKKWSDFFGDTDPEEIRAKLDKYPELEAAANGKMDDEKVSELADKRIATKTAPLERQIGTLTKTNEELQAQLAQYQANERRRLIHDAVREAAQKAKVIPSAVEDALMLSERIFEIGEDGSITAKEGVGVTPGIAPDVWFTEMQPKRAHWWPASQGSGAGGSGGAGGGANNPWSKAHWNKTAQGAYIREHGIEKATQMAKSAGTALHAAHPPA